MGAAAPSRVSCESPEAGRGAGALDGSDAGAEAPSPGHPAPRQGPPGPLVPGLWSTELQGGPGFSVIVPLA